MLTALSDETNIFSSFRRTNPPVLVGVAIIIGYLLSAPLSTATRRWISTTWREGDLFLRHEKHQGYMPKVTDGDIGSRHGEQTTNTCVTVRNPSFFFVGSMAFLQTRRDAPVRAKDTRPINTLARAPKRIVRTARALRHVT